MSQRKPVSKGPSTWCPVCNKIVPQNAKKTRVFCSTACKQKAYRASKTTPIEAAIRKSEASQKRTSTKLATRREFSCKHCGKVWNANGLEGNRIYCDNACKQAAYHAKLAKEKADQQARVDRLKIRGFNSLAAYFYKMNNDFKEAYGYPMVTDGAILYWENDGYYARKDDQTVAYFQSIGVCVKWLSDYFKNKRPNMAMLRKR